MKNNRRVAMLSFLLTALVTGCATPNDKPDLKGIALSPGEISIEVGDAFSFDVLAKPSNAEIGEIYYALGSGEENFATLNDDGSITAILPGTVHVYATSVNYETQESFYAQALVNVLSADSMIDVTSIDVVKQEEWKDVDIGENLHFDALVYPSNASVKEVEWVSTNENVGSIDENGLFTAISHGNTNVYAIAKDASKIRSESFDIYVRKGSEDVLVEQIDVNGPISLQVGSSAKMSASILPAEASHKEVSWSSSNPSVASIAQDGTVLALKEGSTNIIATATDGSNVSSNPFTLSVVANGGQLLVSKITISGDSNPYVGEQIQFNATVYPMGASNKVLTWSSSNTSVATIDDNGLLNALSEGTTSIQAFATDGSGVTSNIIEVNVKEFSGGGGGESTYEGTYYNSTNLDTTGNTLLNNLRNLNKQKRHSTVGYDNMLINHGSNHSSDFYKTDYDPNNPNKILTFYSGKSVNSGLNREHVWPSSRGGGYVDNDIHMPRPTLTSENGNRGNSFYVEGMNHSANGWDPAATNFGLESYRGDAARIIFYCVVADSRLSLVDKTNDSTSNNTMGKLSDLIKWHLSYPVQQREINRNDGAEDLQGNRNPFIDHPDLVCRIWGDYNSSTASLCRVA